MYYTDHFTALLRAHTLLYERGLYMSNVGCVSVRLENQDILMTPTNLHPLLITPASMIESNAEQAQEHLIYALHCMLYRTYTPLSIASALPQAAISLASCKLPELLEALPPDIQMIQAYSNADGSFALSTEQASPTLVFAEGVGFAALADTPLACIEILEKLEHLCRIVLHCTLLNMTEPCSHSILTEVI